jgi:predicted nucleic acid-binding protein
MTRVVVDASVLAAVTFNEPGAGAWVERLEGAALYAPTLLRYELQSVAWKKCRQDPGQARGILEALSLALDPAAGLTWIDPEPADVVLIANTSRLTAYDAAYVCLAGMLGADLATADEALAAAVDAFAGE